jgi:hypothetical protein
VTTPTGLLPNPYPVGLALTLAPAFLLAHGIATAGHALTGWQVLAPDGYSAPYQVIQLAWLVGLVVATMNLLDRLLTRGLALPGRAAFLAIAAALAGSPWLFYSFREPFMAHAAGTFWVTAAVVLVWRLLVALERHELPLRLTWALLACTAMAVVCRPTNVFLLPFGLFAVYRIVRAGMLGRLARQAPLLVTALVPVAAQMLTWQVLFGRPVAYSYGSHGFDWGHPALAQTLFSSRHGLFFWSPLLLVALAGALARLCRGGPGNGLLLCYLVAFVQLWYCNSAWCQWWFGDACGGRAFVELIGLFTVGLGVLFDRWSGAGRSGRLLAGAVAALVLVNIALMGCYLLHRIPRADYLF